MGAFYLRTKKTLHISIPLPSRKDAIFRTSAGDLKVAGTEKMMDIGLAHVLSFFFLFFQEQMVLFI